MRLQQDQQEAEQSQQQVGANRQGSACPVALHDGFQVGLDRGRSGEVDVRVGTTVRGVTATATLLTTGRLLLCGKKEKLSVKFEECGFLRVIPEIYRTNLEFT